MCGFIGIVQNGIIESEITKALDLINYRGPDKEGKFICELNNKKKLFFGHKRLEILDIKSGVQPMISQDKNLVILFNGEIYNHKELRDTIKSLGYNFISSHSDTEVILAGYKIWGTNIVNKLNGMWSFSIFDKIKNILFLSRDRVGEKPLYYSHDSKGFSFSSEYGPLISMFPDKFKINQLNIAKYNCLGFFPKDKTPFNGMYQLPAGNNLVYKINQNTIQIQKFWEFKIEPDYSKSENFWIENLRFLIERSVKNRLVADTEVGIFLSGGIDSTIISHYATQNSSKKIKSFSVNFDQKDFDESQYSDEVSKKYHTDHFKKIIKVSDMIEYFEEYFKVSNDLISDSSLISYYKLCKSAKNKVKVVLGGDGSDELFAGYDTFKAIKYLEWLNKTHLNKSLPLICKLINLFPSNHKNMNFKFKTESFLKYNSNKISTANPLWISPLTLNQTNQILDKNFKLEEIYEEIIDEWDKNTTNNNLDKTLIFYFKFFLQSQMMVKVDRLSMLNSLEVRSPFLDYDIIDLVSNIPFNLKLKGNTTKYILKKTFENIIPKNIVHRKKQGLSSPLSKTIMKSDFKLKSNNLKNKQFLLNHLLSDHKNYKRENRLPIWNILKLDNFFFKINL